MGYGIQTVAQAKRKTAMKAEARWAGANPLHHRGSEVKNEIRKVPPPHTSCSTRPISRLPQALLQAWAQRSPPLAQTRRA